MNNITHFMLPEHTNGLYKSEAISSISLTREVANKINELVDAYNEFAKTDLEWKQEQDGRTRKAVIYMKDNLINSLNELLESLINEGFVDDRILKNLTTLSNRIDNLLTNVSSGSTTRDAELIDIRTAYDGEVFSNAGYSVRNQIERSMKSSLKFIQASSYAGFGLTDANKINDNIFYFIHANITESMIANLSSYGNHGILLNFKPLRSQGGSTQIHITTGGFAYRIGLEVGGNLVWEGWNKLAINTESKPIQNNDLIGAFMKVGVIGDSLSVGHIQDRDDTSASPRQLDYSWVSFLAKDTGSEYVHLGRSGATTKSWFTDAQGYTEFVKSENLCQAYIICLGANDVAYVSLGSRSDIDLTDKTKNGDTYYGNYAKIIQTIKEVNPTAKIFTMTMPTPRINANYNNAVREITEMFDDCFLVDLERNYDNYFSTGVIRSDYVNGHYTALGYRAIASVNKIALSNTIAENYVSFHNIDEIPYN